MHPSHFAILFLFGATAIHYSVSTKQPHRKVLILGAGLSGIVAGNTLKEQGIDDFLVLEGQDHIGGRVKQAEISGYKIEEGANFIHYVGDKETKPLWKQKKTKNMAGFSVNPDNAIFRNETGTEIKDYSSYVTFTKALSKVDKLIKERRKQNMAPISTREGLSLLGWTPSTPFQYALEWIFLEMTSAKKVEHLQFSSLEGITKEEQNDFFITDQRGLIELYKDMYKGFENNIKTNKTIIGIKYNSSFVEVTTKDGEVYTADFALCTFSTAVLDSDMVTFTPPLPDWKKNAIANRPLGALTKIFIKFAKKFWDDKLFIGLANEKRGYYPVIMNLDLKGAFPGSGLMLMFVSGDEARRVEKQSDQETKAEIVKLLRGIYGQKFTEPTDIHYERWTQNPHVRGAYSDDKIGSVTSTTSANLQTNLGNLYFAGEATSEEWHGYMQGAYLTGYKQAKAIAAAINLKGE